MNDNIITKSDLDEFQKEVLQNLSQQLIRVKQELELIKAQQEETQQKTEIELELKAKDEQIQNLRNYHQICKKFAEERIPIETPIINKSNEFIEVIENENGVDGYTMMVVKKVMPERKELDMDLDVKNGVVSKRGY